MKRNRWIPVVLGLLFLSSCEVIDQLVPDVEKTITETFDVTIDANVAAGETEKIFVDVTDSDEYQDYKDNIKGYEINEITFEIINYNAPEDLYFTGNIVAFDDAESTFVTIGDLDPVSLKEVADAASEYPIYQGEDGFNQVLEWLEDPGNFNLKFTYNFQDSMGADYTFEPEDFGSTFQLKVHFYMTILTGL